MIKCYFCKKPTLSKQEAEFYELYKKGARANETYRKLFGLKAPAVSNVFNKLRLKFLSRMSQG